MSWKPVGFETSEESGRILSNSVGEEREQGYLYAHDYPNHYVEQQYLPYELSGKEFYKPSGNGYEVKIREHFKKIKGL